MILLDSLFAGFEKVPFTLAEVQELMKDPSTFPPIIHYAVPVMLGLVLLEFILSQRENRNVYHGKDFLASVGIGVGNLVSTALTNTVMFAVVLFFYNMIPWTVPITWWSFIICFVALDFARYWAHRVAHENRFFWATHVTHHSSEEYNFAVSFRLSWVQQIKIIFFLPVVLMGFHPVVFFIVHQIEVLGQFWIHTKLIKKLPAPIEFIFTTPSHHRVHHARNPKYLDKNYGSTFIIWDRMFGTFQEEEEEPEYGIISPPDSFNPAYLVFHEFIDIYKDVKEAKDWKTKWNIVMKHPAWLKEQKALQQRKEQKVEKQVA